MEIAEYLLNNFSKPLCMLLTHNENKIEDINIDDMEYLTGIKEITKDNIFHKLIYLIDKYDINISNFQVCENINISYDDYHFIINNEKLFKLLDIKIKLNEDINFDTITLGETKGKILSNTVIPKLYYLNLLEKFKNSKSTNDICNKYILPDIFKLFPTIINNKLETSNLNNIKNFNLAKFKKNMYSYTNVINYTYNETHFIIYCIYDNHELILEYHDYENDHNGDPEHYYNFKINNFDDIRYTQMYKLCEKV